jgi:uncharacterized protein
MHMRLALSAAIFSCAIVFTTSANAAPPYINCAKARFSDEKAICKNTQLIQMDAQMSTMYDIILGLVAMGTRDALKDEQVQWLIDRRACRADRACLREFYEFRIEELDRYIDRARQQGPF